MYSTTEYAPRGLRPPASVFALAAWLTCCGLAGGQTTPTEAECEDGQCRLQFAETAAPGGEPLFSYRRPDGGASAVEGNVANPLRPPVEQTPAGRPLADGHVQGVEYAAPIDEDTYALAAATPEIEPPVTAPPVAEPATAPLTATATPLPGTLVETPTSPSDDRRLAPPSTDWSAESDGAYASRARSTAPSILSRLKGLSSAGAGLAIVVALLLACAWLLRKGGPKPGGVLPSEAFAVLGRAPLTSQSFAQLLRVGNKLVLVAVTADGAQPLAEVTDAAEVDRIAGLCMGGRSSGSSAEFQQVLAQLSREPARGFLGREGSAARRR
jgi:flagellar biogenesis protein FliO